jgi:predicted amidohydrolase
MAASMKPTKKIIKIATTSLATLEDTAPPYNLRHPDPEDNLRLGLSLLEAAGEQGADLAVLPEGFMAAGLPGAHLRSVAQPIPGPAFDAVADCARRYSMYVVAGFYTVMGEQMFNVASLIDREGRLAGMYAKNHPTEGEIDCGVTPGTEVPVFDTDFGKVGLSICFDINWQPFWSGLAEKGADLVCWISAYEGGFPLQAYAWLHQYPVVSSVWPYHAKVIDVTGRVLASSSRWGRLAVCDLNLDKRLFHTDGQHQHVLSIQTRYGQRVRVETYTEEHLFTVESQDPSLDVEQVIEEFGLVEYKSYVERCTSAQLRTRSPLPWR